MSEKLVFIYDGECPFCNHFAELLELKSGLTNISILNGRENMTLMSKLLKKGFDLNEGAILLNGDEVLHGAAGLNFLSSQINKEGMNYEKMCAVVDKVASSQLLITLGYQLYVFHYH